MRLCATVRAEVLLFSIVGPRGFAVSVVVPCVQKLVLEGRCSVVVPTRRFARTGYPASEGFLIVARFVYTV
jgi:hypothetical protein